MEMQDDVEPPGETDSIRGGYARQKAVDGSAVQLDNLLSIRGRFPGVTRNRGNPTRPKEH